MKSLLMTLLVVMCFVTQAQAQEQIGSQITFEQSQEEHGTDQAQAPEITTLEEANAEIDELKQQVEDPQTKLKTLDAEKAAAATAEATQKKRDAGSTDASTIFAVAVVTIALIAFLYW